jgi:tripartite-type tricarboxylate transporter receptor subunit TctC
MSEAGVSNVHVSDCQGILFPQGTPKAIVDKVACAVRAPQEPETVTRFTVMRLDVIASTSDKFRKAIEEDSRRRALVMKAGGIINRLASVRASSG